MDHTELTTMVQTTTQELLQDGLISTNATTEYAATLLGQAIVASSLTPEDGLFVHRELQKAIQDQARHAQQLLHLKRQSLENFTRDQIDLLKERQRIERETDKMRMQNEKHPIREIQRQAREAAEAHKQRKLDQIRHTEEKYAFKLSQLKRPAFAERGIDVDDLAHWKVGRPLNASL